MSSADLLYSSAQVRALDARTIAAGTSAYTLMKRAGEAALRTLRSRWPTAMRITVVAGGGNNGGDGYVLARFAQAAGLSARVLAVVSPERLTGAAREACEDFRASGGRLLAYARPLLHETDVIVDALLGTGLRSAVREPAAEVIEAINASGRPVLALDVPSGLNADGGAVLGQAVRADCTISFVALKTGLFLGAGPDCCGRVLFDDLEVSVPDEPEFLAQLERLGETEIGQALPARPREAHKGQFGRVLFVSGPVMPGAVRLAAEACLRVGAGLVSVASQPHHLTAIVAARPELIVQPIGAPEELDGLMKLADVIAVGPGLGRAELSRSLLDRALASGRALVLDADALNLLAERSGQAPPGSVLTPHPGEAARLLGWSTEVIQADRLAALQELLARQPGCIVVLKGAGTLVGMQGRVAALCERGNPGMATAGMGDVLTGAIAGILGQCRDPWRAARAGVIAHALAGDELAREHARGLLALEVAERLSRWVSPHR